MVLYITRKFERVSSRSLVHIIYIFLHLHDMVLVGCAHFWKHQPLQPFEGNTFQVRCDLTETGKFPGIDDETTYRKTL